MNLKCSKCKNAVNEAFLSVLETKLEISITGLDCMMTDNVNLLIKPLLCLAVIF